MFPLDQGLVGVTPVLSAYARSTGGPYGIDYTFQVCGEGISCFSSGVIGDRGAWRVPAGKLAWGKSYSWTVTANDRGTGGVTSKTRVFLTGVRQPAVTSQLAANGANGQEFHQLTGNYTTSFTDAEVATVGPPLTVSRSYNSLDPRTDGMFGASWSSRWDMKIVEESAGEDPTAVVTYPDGRRVRFAGNTGGSYQPPPGVFATLAKTSSGGSSGWRLMDKSATVYAFDAQGRLTGITDNRGRAQTLTYGADAKLAKVTATGGRSLTFTWTGDHVTAVSTDPVGGATPTWTYRYDGDRLTQVCTPGAAPNCTAYDHDTGSQYRSRVLDSDPAGYWRLGEASGTVAADLAQETGDATYSGAGLGQPGALAGTQDTAVQGNVALPENTVARLGGRMSVEVWFKTSRSGTILSAGDSGDSVGANRPVLYVGTDGKVRGQLWDDPQAPAVTPITSAVAVNDGQWHHLVLTAQNEGQILYLDGLRAGTLAVGPDGLRRQFAYLGTGWIYNSRGWPATPPMSGNTYAVGFPFVGGTMDELAVYDKVLSEAEVRSHYAARAEMPFKLTKITLPSGRVWARNVYDATTERVKSHTDQHGGTWQVGSPVYSPVTGLATVTVTDPHAGKLEYRHDAWRGYRMVSSSDQLGKTTAYMYDTGGYLTKLTDPNGNVTETFQDERGNVVGTKTCRTASSCQTEHVSYHLNKDDPFDPRNDRAIVARDPRSSSATDDTYATKWEYTSFGEESKETTPATPDFPNGRPRTYVYTDGTEPAAGGGTTPAGLLKSEKDAKGNEWSYRYTASGDVAEEVHPSGLVTRYGYDAIGQLTSRTEVSDAYPAGVTTRFGYDALGRLVTHTGAAVRNEISDVTHTSETRYAYDPDGNKLSDTVVDLTGGDAERKIAYDLDDYGRVSKITGPEGGVVQYSWDHTGALTAVTDELGTLYNYGYTARGELATQTLKNWTGSPVNPQAPRDVVLHSNAYDPGGRLASEVDAMGRKAAYAYYNDDLPARTVADDARLNGSTTPRDVVVEANDYDAAGNLVQVIEGDGRVRTDYGYDAADRLISETFDPLDLNRKITYVYDANDNVVKETATGAGSTRAEVTEYAYDQQDEVVRRTGKNGDEDLVSTRTVDQRGLTTEVTDPRGNRQGADRAGFTTTLRYDAAGRLVEVKAPEVQVERAGAAAPARPTTRYGYDGAGLRTHTVDPEGRRSTATYDRAGRVVAARSPAYTPPGGSTLTPTVTYAYDAAGRVTRSTDPRDQVTTAEYDVLGNRVRVTDPAPSGGQGGRWVSEFDLLGEQLATVDPTGARMEATYDDLGRQITATIIERKPTTVAHTTRYVYNDDDVMTSVVRPGNRTTGYVVNAAGEVKTETDPAGNSSTFTYDLAGRTVKAADPLGNATVAEYDLAGRQIAAKDLDDKGATLRTVGFGYDAASNPTTFTSGEGYTTSRKYDGAGSLIELVEPVSATDSITTRYGYDAGGALTRTTDGRGNTVWTTYNGLGEVESITEPSTAAHPQASDRTWTYVYDADGNEVSELRPGGVRIDREIDHLGRVIREAGSGAQAQTPERTFSYDLTGRMTGVGDYTLDYDDRGLLLKVSKPSGQVASFAYDALGYPTERNDTTGKTTYTWEDNRLATAADPVSGRAFTYGYDKADRLTTLTSATPRNVQTFAYDALDRLTSHTLADSGGSQLAKIAYGWDKDDNLVAKTSQGTAGAGANTYGYDRAGRLTSWTAPNGDQTIYTWDAAGNRTGAGEDTFLFDERNRLISGGGSSYTYTPRGTLATESAGGATRNLAFDAFDRMVSDGDVTYRYDALGRLDARRAADGSEQRFSYSGLNNDIISVSDGAGAVQGKYGRDPAGNLLSLQEGTGPALGVMSDLHDDVVATYSGTAVVDSAAFTPFGEVITRTGTPRAMGYQGEWTDPDTGKVNMAARWYVPGTGGFASRDDWEPDSTPSIALNRYTYAYGDPLAYTDPSGNCPMCIPLALLALRIAAQIAARALARKLALEAAKRAAIAIAKRVAARKALELAKRKAADIARKKAAALAKQKAQRAAAKKAQDAAKKAAQQAAKKQAKTPSKQSKNTNRTSKGPKSKTSKNNKTSKGNKSPKKPQAKNQSRSGGKPSGKTGGKSAGPKGGGKPTGKSGSGKGGSKPTGKGGGKSGGKSGGKGGGKGGKSTKSPQEKKNEIAEEVIDEALGLDPSFSVGGNSPIGGGRDGTPNLCTSLAACARDVVEEVVQNTVEDLVNDLIDDVAPDLPPGTPPGADSCRPGNSFVAGTKVLMADGSRKPIEDIKVGDHVVATDPKTGRVDAGPVTTLITGTGEKTLVEITVDIDGRRGDNTDKITATAGHPFWLPHLRKWLPAGELQPGAWLQTSAGTWVQVTAIKTSTRHQRVHNLTIEGLHTYHVVAGDQAILVHNDDPDPYRRPKGFRKGVRAKVWESAMDPDTGLVTDPLTGEVMDKSKRWDMGHLPGYEFRKHRQSALDRGISRKQFLDEHNDPTHYRPELPSSNSCHRGEDHSDDYFGP
ncbi:GH-E family nuclease [Sphaerisporangium siamense]|uniref:RHS repeat-associated protein n=1 Tax=Sphaerisporangium siamense TaxID=795645 RepID=A0A7W7DDX4_9ACTN|nr:GH-E family nuclease [Sphaerisporangium siamense]MBB4703608.1 RHS repeat-associated protein [Sphaerisporangium siamense]